MTLNDYQIQASVFRLPEATPEERIFGLLEEAGEVAGVFKRVFRGDYDEDPQECSAKLKKELGDVLWYLSQIAFDMGWSLSDVAEGNLAKLADRRNRNVISGAGDDR